MKSYLLLLLLVPFLLKKNDKRLLNKERLKERDKVAY